LVLLRSHATQHSGVAMISRHLQVLSVAACIFIAACDNEIRCTYRGATLMGVDRRGILFHDWVFGAAILGGERNANVLPSIVFILGASSVAPTSLTPSFLRSIGVVGNSVSASDRRCPGANTTYVVKGGIIYFDADRVVCVVVRGDWERKGGLLLAVPGRAARFQFPLSEDEATTLFGEPVGCSTSHYSGQSIVSRTLSLIWHSPRRCVVAQRARS